MHFHHTLPHTQFVNPEVREARKQKEEWTKMSRPERHRTILDRMASMRDINDDSTKRLAVRDEAEIREFLEGAAAEREEKEQWWNERGPGAEAGGGSGGRGGGRGGTRA